MVDNPELGWPLVRAAREEYLCPATCFAYGIGLLHKSPGLWNFVAAVLRAKRAHSVGESGIGVKAAITTPIEP
jgi:hypothetical protein